MRNDFDILMLFMLEWKIQFLYKYQFRYRVFSVIGTSVRSLAVGKTRLLPIGQCTSYFKVTQNINFKDWSVKNIAGSEALGSRKMCKSTKDTLFTAVAPRNIISGNKITIVGVGMVGVATAFSILTQHVSNDLVLIDPAKNRLLGEALDFQHGSQFLRGAKINASTDYAISKGSRICIITSGVRSTEGERRKDLLQRNVDVIKTIVPPLVKYSPNTILLVVTNPVDVLTYASWKISGLPPNRVIGSGANLDTSRFRFLISQKLGISPSACDGWIIGEHGDNSVPVWSGMNVGTVHLQQINPKIGTTTDPENWKDIHKGVVSGGYEVVKLKGYTSWAIALSVSEITHAIMSNSGTIHSVSLLANGFHGIKDDVFLSLPAILGDMGVSDVLNQQLSNDERKALQDSANVILEQQKSIVF